MSKISSVFVKPNQDEKAQKDLYLVENNSADAFSLSFLCCHKFICPCFGRRMKDKHSQSKLEPTKNNGVSNGKSPPELLLTPPRFPRSPGRVPPISPCPNGVAPLHLDMNQIVKATRNFSESNLIGEGGFAKVYKGELPSGRVVAVKRAKKEHIDAVRSEFCCEVDLLSKIEHRNLVRLLGYIDQGSEAILYSEYMPNGTLREHLDVHYGKVLDFTQRLKISMDVAHALTYLHSFAGNPVIHRDVKSSNILLTDGFMGKVSDFGFARVTSDEESHVMTNAKGTLGYLDPEYLRTRKLTPKSDVFSYGILLVEILSGRRPVDSHRDPSEKVTVRWAFKMYTQGKMRDILDPSIDETIHGEVLRKLFDLAFRCAAPTRVDRPTMHQVGETLWEIRKEHMKYLRIG